MINEANAGLTAVGNVMPLIDRVSKALKGYEVKGENIRIKCPENRIYYEVSIEVGRGKIQRPRHVNFHVPNISSISMRALPTFENCNSALSRSPSGYTLYTDLLPNSDFFILEFEFQVPGSEFLKSIVRRESKRDSQGGNTDRYWMHALLKHREGLKSKYGNVDLEDLDFMVDVGIHQNIKDVVPKPFVDSMENAAKLLKTSDRNEAQRLVLDRLRRKGSGSTGDELQILEKMQELFTAKRFRDYITITDRFKFSEVRRGTDFYETIPFPTFPKVMTVVSRTNLSFDKPAAEGSLNFEKDTFLDQLESLFPRAAKAAKRKK